MAHNSGGGAPGSGAPGSSGGRMFQWKGKATSTPPSSPAAAVAPESAVPEPAAALEEAASPSSLGSAGDARLERMASEMSEMHSLLLQLSERDTHNEKAFNTLHAELGDYKKDFIYEHLKPVVRPLLFLFDSIESFESEIEAHEVHASAQPLAAGVSGGGEVMPTRIVRQNAVFFREQLVEALRICEVTPMDAPSGRPDARHHKVIRVVPVAPEQDGLIQGVVRSGWFLNGHLLRPAEVVLGRNRD